MNRLFSPWRSAYIHSFQEKKRSRGCLLCRIKKEKNDKINLIVWRGEYCFVVLNRFPYNSGHVMIVPYRHTARFSKLSTEEHSEIMSVLARTLEALNRISQPHGYNFGANLGRVAGAGIDRHIHFHLVPRWNGDTNFMPILSDIKLVSERIQDVWAKLNKEMNKKS